MFAQSAPVGPIVVPFPASFNERDACVFVEHLNQVLDAPRLLIDMTTLKWVEPFGTLVAACGLRLAVLNRRRKGFSTKFKPELDNLPSNSACSYLRAFGFFDYITRERETYRAPLRGGMKYLPITRLSLTKIESDEEPIQESVDKYSDRLAGVLFPDQVGAQIMLAYCLREIIRNTFEHAEVDECVLMAQRWTNSAEIAIADAGCGIHHTIASVHGTRTPEASIALALKPGICGLSANVDTGDYQNTGFGLFVVSELGSRYGEFSIQSSERLLICRKGNKEWLSSRAVGTCVKLKVDLSDGEYFPNILSGIVDAGERLAGEIPGAVEVASGASKSPSLSRSKRLGKEPASG